MGVADRVNLGLIPSAEMSYGAACRALRPDTGGVLHVHGNVADADDEEEDNDIPTKSKITIAIECPFKHRSWRNWALETARKICQGPSTNDICTEGLNNIYYKGRLCGFCTVAS